MIRWNDARRDGSRRRAGAAAGLALLVCAGAPAARAQSVTVAVDRSSYTPLAPNFSGGNIASPDSPVELTDPAVQAFVRPLQTGIVRWPGGKVDDFFIWETGLIPPPAGSPTSKARSGIPTPIDILKRVFSPYPSLTFGGEVAKAVGTLQPILAGKGGNPLGDQKSGFGGFAGAIGARFVTVVNATTDTVASIELLAFTIAQRRLPVVAFELVNEPYFLVVPTSDGPITLPAGSPRVPGAYTDGRDYLTKMKPYRDAIKRGFQDAGVDTSRAVVTIGGGFAADTSGFNQTWMADLAAYTQAHGAWWDGIVYHFYPPETKSDSFATKMTYANDALATGTDPFIAAYRAANYSAGKPLFVTEYDVTLDDRAIEGSVYAGVFCAEYVGRMSRYPETADVLVHELFTSSDGVGVPDTAIDGTGSWQQKLTAAGQAGQVLDTTGRIHGLFYTAQILGVGLADAAVNDSDRVFGTTVTGATGSVPTRTATLPAVFAQAYRGRDGNLHVLATNKGKAAGDRPDRGRRADRVVAADPRPAGADGRRPGGNQHGLGPAHRGEARHRPGHGDAARLQRHAHRLPGTLMGGSTLAALRRGELAGARELRFGGETLAEFPREVFGLADTLEVLDLGGTGIGSLPDDMGRLGQARRRSSARTTPFPACRRRSATARASPSSGSGAAGCATCRARPCRRGCAGSPSPTTRSRPCRPRWASGPRCRS